MIAIAGKFLNTKCKHLSIIRGVGAVLALVVLASCSNSKFVLGPLYNRLDDQMRKEFNKLANYNDDQTAYFEDRLQTYHLWHRRIELPRYAALLDDIENAISVPKRKTAADVTRWTQTIEEFSQLARTCHPVNYSFALMKSLNDEQINFIERRFAREQKKNQDKYRENTLEERKERRYKNVIKWAGRIGLDFNSQQKKLLKTALNEQISLREQYWALSAEWNQEFFVLARKQNASNYDETMQNHLNKLWNLLENNHGDQWRANREIWTDFFVNFTNAMDTSQREWADAWLGKLAETLRDLSNDEVNFDPNKVQSNGASLGCL